MVCIEFSSRHGKTSLKLGSCCLMMSVYFMLAFIYSTNHSPLLLVFDGQTCNMGGLNLTFLQMSVSIVKTDLRSHSPFQYTWLDPIAALWGSKALKPCYDAILSSKIIIDVNLVV